MASPAPATSPPANSTSPPPATSTTPPPAPASSPPPAPSTSAPPPSTPPPSPPTAPPPSTATPPPSTPSSPPAPSPPSTSPPPSSTPSSPSPPAPSTPSPPATKTPPSPTSGGGGGKSSPSPPSRSSGSGSGSGSESGGGSNGISTGVVVGIAIAGVAILVVVSLICVCCTRKKKRRRDEYGGEGYYVPPHPHPNPPPPKDGQYGVQAQHWQQNYPPPVEHYQVPKPPPPPAAPLRPPRSPSPQPPPPAPAPFMSSGGVSGSSFGSENPLPPPSPGISFGFSKSTFTYEELAMATDGFSEANLLGQGGFGYVHKGVLPNGKEVAVKALKAGSGQGEREFQAEVEIISRVHHKHLVSLVGYCITGSQRLLVYEFVPNSTMEFHLHGKPTMDWPTRLKIALGAAKGLAYLHEDCHPKIIHRDIKSANILLDYKFEAKVADFGLAKFSSDVNTHISTRVMGTFGYLAPEYASSGKLTDKSDVFSYGVMLLELITGRRPVDTTNTYMDDSLVDWARPQLTRALEENNFDSLVDQRLQNNFNPNEMARMVACAAACVRHSARRRPRMSQVVRALEGEVSLSDLNEGIRPGHSSIYSSYGSSDYDSGQYKEDMKKFRKMALASQEHGSSEYGGTTSEYGMYPSGSSSEGQTTREMEMGKMKPDSRGFSGGS